MRETHRGRSRRDPAIVAGRPSPPSPRATRTTSTGRCRASTCARPACGAGTRRRRRAGVDVRPGRVLRVDGTATERALWDAGRHWLRAAGPALADPSPPAIDVDPVLIVRPGGGAGRGRGLAPRCRSRGALRSSCAAASASIPAAPRRRGRSDAARRSLAQASLTGARTLAPSLTHVEPELDDRRRRGRGRRGARRSSSRRSRSSSTARTSARSRPRSSAKLLRFRPAATASSSPSTRERLAKAVEPMLAPWRPRAGNARFVVAGKQVRIVPSRPGLDVDGRGLADSIAAAAAAPTHRASLPLKQIRADRTTREAERARDPRAHLHLHDRHGHLVVEPDPQRPADGASTSTARSSSPATRSRSTTASARAPSSEASARGR